MPWAVTSRDQSQNGIKIAGLAIVPFLIAAAIWRIIPNILIDADTPRYLANDPMRTATYPLFLDLFYGPALLPIQLMLFAGALSWLALYASRLLPLLAASAIVLAIGANPYLWQLQATAMSEALTTPLLTVVVGLIIGFTARQGAGTVIAASLLCGIATTVRPACAALLVVPLSAIVSANLDRRFKLVGLTLLAFAAPIALERAYSRIIHGNALTSPLGRHVFMKAAVIDAPMGKTSSTDVLDRRLVDSLNYDFAAVRAELDAAPNWHIRYILLTNYEACAAWGCGDIILQGIHRPRPEIDAALMRAGLARLRANPVGYLRLSATEYHRMWLLHPRKHPDLASLYNAFLAKEAPLPFQQQLGVEARPTPLEEQSQLLRINRAAFAAVGLFAALLMVTTAVLHHRKLNRAAFPVLLGGQAVLILSAFTAVGSPRYAMGMWPMIIAGVVLGALGLLRLRGLEKL